MLLFIFSLISDMIFYGTSNSSLISSKQLIFICEYKVEDMITLHPLFHFIKFFANISSIVLFIIRAIHNNIQDSNSFANTIIVVLLRNILRYMLSNSEFL